MGNVDTPGSESRHRSGRRKGGGTAALYQLKITLNGIYPEISRRVLVSSDIRLNTLHRIIQAAMGWTDSHLHMFVVGEQYYADPANDEWEEMNCADESSMRLREIAPWIGDRFQYDYDFGDRWIHDVVVENILPGDSGFEHPTCLSGEGACPPEDCGGVSGYSAMVHAIRDRRHDEHNDMLRWVGGKFDPDAFDREAANNLLKRFQKRRR